MNFDPSKLKYEFKEFIAIYENAFTHKECNDSIKLFEEYHKSGYTYSRIKEKSVILPKKDDTSVNIDPFLEIDCDKEFIASFHERFYNYIYPLYNIQYPIMQTLLKHRSKYIKIQKTCPTQGYHVWHCENDGTYSNRVLSWILYLNDIEDGGETEFLYQSLRIRPKQGTFILFPAYFTHTHRGNPPLNKCKYIATGWIEFFNMPEPQGVSNFPNLGKIKKNKINYN